MGLTHHPARWYLVIVGIVVLATMDVDGQVVPYPYTPLVQSERNVAFEIDEGSVRRANEELRSIAFSVTLSASHDAMALRRADVLTASGFPSTADKLLADFTRDRPNSPSAAIGWVQRGLDHLSAGMEEEASTLLGKGAKVSQEEFIRRNDVQYQRLSHLASYWQGVARARSGLFAEAITSFEQCIAISPSGKYADRCYFAIGQVYERNRETQKAIDAFAAIRTQHGRGSVVIAARIREAQNYLRLRQPERAVDVLVGVDDQIHALQRGDSSIALPQYDADHAAEEVRVLRITALEMRGRYDLALDSCRTFLTDFPASDYIPLIHLNAGFASLSIDSSTAALRHLDRVLETVTDETSDLRNQALLYKALALRRSGKTSESARMFLDLGARSDYPFRAQALVEVGQGAYQDGRFDDAMKALERAERASNDAATTIRAMLLLGATFIEQQKWAKAADVYERLITIADRADPAYVPNKNRALEEARLKRGVCLVQSGEKRDAIASLTDFLAKHPLALQRDEASFWLAEAMYGADLLKNAEELYLEVVNTFTASIRREEALYGLAWTYFRKRDFKRSTDYFGKLLEGFPRSKFATEALVRRGDGLYITKNYAAAARQYEEAARRDGKSAEGQYAAYQTGQALYRAGQLNEASTRLKAFVTRYSASRLADDALFLSGWIEFQRGHDAEAIAEFRRLLDAYPDGDHAIRALYTIADAQYNMGDVDAAVKTYQQVISRYPGEPLASEAAKSMQMAYIGQGRTEEALAIADALINANPTSPLAEEFAFKKAEIFYSGQNYASAASELDAYIKKYPSSQRNDEAMYLLGKTFLTMDDEKQASAAFKDLERKHRDSPLVGVSKLDLASFYENKANARAADSLYAIVMEDHADDTASASRAGFERATLARMNGDTTKALRVYRLTADRYPNTEYGDQSRYQLSLYYRKIGQRDSARTELAILARTTSNKMIIANALYDIADTYARERRWQEAADSYAKVRENYAGYEDWYTMALIGLGACYEQLELLDEAKIVYGIVVELRPDDDFGRTAQARLDRLRRKP
jgi:TolA-binding protein